MAQSKFLTLSGLSVFKDNIMSIIEENELVTSAALVDLNSEIDAIKNHNHDDDYAALGHNHDTVYAKLAHNHNFETFSTQRDFMYGTLIKTDINYNVSSGDPFYVEIKGNTYTSLGSMYLQAQGYIYNDTIINYSITSLGVIYPETFIALNISGYLCFWFPRIAYWHGYSIKVTTGYNYSINRVVSVLDSAEPTGTKRVEISNNYYKNNGYYATIFENTGKNLVFAGPSSGDATKPTFRTLTINDLPTGTTSTTVALGNHTHTKSQITDFAHTHTKSEITDFAHTHTKSQITDFAHTHTKSQITDFAHTHTKSEITDFAHTHTILTPERFDTNAPKPNEKVGLTFQFSLNLGTDATGWWNVLNMRSYTDKSYTSAQLITPANDPGKDTGYSGDMKWRQGRNATWLDWKTILDSSNYTSYTVKKDGTGASGTWGINITGSAGSVAWGNVTGKPSEFSPSSHSHSELTPESISDPNLAYSDQKLKYYFIQSTNTGGPGYAGKNYGFPVAHNANSILWLGNHSGTYGGQLGISGNGYLYYRCITSGSFPTDANGASWNRIAYKSEIPTSLPANSITGLATVATTGSYNDLLNKPTIPAAYDDTVLSASLKDLSEEVDLIGDQVSINAGDIGVLKNKLGLDATGTVTSIIPGTGLTNGTTKDAISSTGTLNLKVAATNEIGGIKIGYTQSGKNYPVQLTNTYQAYVNVPWTDENYYPTAFNWTNGTTAGPTANIVMNDASKNFTISAIPAASGVALSGYDEASDDYTWMVTTQQSGIVTTGAQSFSGQKFFNDGIWIGTNNYEGEVGTDDVKIHFGDTDRVWIGEKYDDQLTLYAGAIELTLDADNDKVNIDGPDSLELRINSEPVALKSDITPPMKYTSKTLSYSSYMYLDNPTVNYCTLCSLTGTTSIAYPFFFIRFNASSYTDGSMFHFIIKKTISQTITQYMRLSISSSISGSSVKIAGLNTTYAYINKAFTSLEINVLYSNNVFYAIINQYK